MGFLVLHSFVCPVLRVINYCAALRAQWEHSLESMLLCGAEVEVQQPQCEAIITSIMKCSFTLSWIICLQLGRVSWCRIERRGRGTGSVPLLGAGV